MHLRIFLLSALWASLSCVAGDARWPREFQSETHRVILHQPQVDQWDQHTKIVFVAVIEIAPMGTGKSVYGVLEAEANTETNVSTRMVRISELKEKAIRFPTATPADAESLIAKARKALPSTQGKSIEVGLDRVLAGMEVSPAAQKSVDVNLDPPKIFYSDKPAILVIFMGQPKFKEVPGTSLMAALNTNWDVFLDTDTSIYYLLNGDSWLEATDPTKEWKAAKALPATFSKLPDDPNWADVKKNIPGMQAEKAPRVFVSTDAAELIVSDGSPKFTPIPGTHLMLADTSNVIFKHNKTKLYYLQVAGRWFKAEELKGPWQASSKDLPEDFAKIPDDNPAAFVKASVPGTEEAKDAVLLASVPQKTTVKIDEAKLEVRYDGDPRFYEIKGTSVKYALNTPNDVFLVDGGYYCCYQGMWFAAPKATGPWVICTKVPPAIYTIPTSSPKHNVTYVYVYETTPQTVTVGYTSGYSGEYVASTGVLMFGLGIAAGIAIADGWDDNCWSWHYGYHCRSYYYSYGCGAVYHHGYGAYYRGAAYYGPYGGAGYGGAYNPATGGWARGAYAYGPNGAAGVRAGYNPFTDTYAARAVAKTPYGSSGRFYAERGNTEVWGGHESGARGTVGWAQTDKGSGVVHADTVYGQGTVAKDKDGNVYAGKDGNVYKKSDDGWQKYQGSGEWENANMPTRTESRTTTTNSTRQQPTTSNTTKKDSAVTTRDTTQSRPSTTGSSSDWQQRLNSDASSRQRGQYNTERSTHQGFKNSGGGTREGRSRKR